MLGQVTLADFFTDSNDDAFPTNHRAQTQSDGHRKFYPHRNEFSRLVERSFVFRQCTRFAIPRKFVVLIQFADGFSVK